MDKSIRSAAPGDISPLLAEITDPPKSLRLQGTFPETERYLTVVGSRKYTEYGKVACEALIAGLAGYPVAIISGLALGMDGIALRAALHAKLPTIAVPGSGLSDAAIHPKTNIGIRDDILRAGGCILSEFPDDFKATLYSFPQRNRIMAGLAHATLVIEAELQSGTLITSKFATEYNRDVFTIPHSIFNKTGEGPHMLMRLGATPIRSSEDILLALGLTPQENLLAVERDYSDCSPDEIRIIEFLSSPQPRDEIIAEMSLQHETPVHVIQTTLSILEIKGLIKEEMGEIRLT